MNAAPALGDGPIAGPLAHATSRPATDATIAVEPDSPLGRWQAVIHDATMAHLVRHVEACGAVGNLRRVRDGGDGEYDGMWFADSDVYKTLEALAWDAGLTGTEQHKEWSDAVVALIDDVQEQDGYINSWHQLGKGTGRWSNLGVDHEMYCAGHLIQAGIARARALGDQRLLTAARRFADHLVERYGPGREAGLPGHPLIESALVELFRETGERTYLGLAVAMIDRRGHGLLGRGQYGPAYFQDAVPVREAQDVMGHAVRQLYLLVGVADIVLETGDADLWAALQRLWEAAQNTKTYITGGQGSRHRDESFGDPYELPNDRAYAESCAAVASIMWNWRMLLIDGHRRYADVIETTVVNALRASMAQTGTAFFYSNPLHLRSGHDGAEEDAPSTRLPWYAIPCCPPNVSRLVSTLATYALSVHQCTLTIHQYFAGRYTVPVESGRWVLEMATSYPSDGRVTLTVHEAPTDARLRIRIPGWCTSWTVRRGGHPCSANIDAQGYACITAPGGGEDIELLMEMEAEVVTAHPRVDACRGAVAFRRGPVVYCLDDAHNPGLDVDGVDVIAQASPSVGPTDYGLPTLHAKVRARTEDDRPYANRTAHPYVGKPVDVTLAPYGHWANAPTSQMRVWMPIARQR